ncbi:MAG: glycosyltransferase family 4 protein [Chloroflexaceae bacterium]|nr:glycosyltransferase family 4 protein [Chloroflexaceae bacterium]
MAPYRFAFILEQTLGHATHQANLRAAVNDDAGVTAIWATLDFAARGPLERLPGLRNWTVRAGRQARRRLARAQGGGPLDALFFHTQTAAVLATDWIARVPSVISFDATPLQLDQMGSAYGHRTSLPLIERFKAGWHRVCYRAARHLVTWSRWTAESLTRDYGVPAAKISVVAPGVDLAFWRRPEEPRERAGPLRILFVGGDFERKGGPDLLAAARGLPANAVELHLVTEAAPVAGPGIHVHRGLRPNSPALRDLYHRCDIFCLPTRGDCLPLAVIEAAAAGLPIISASIGAIPEVVRPGETGVLVPPGDVPALAAALRGLIEAPEQRHRLGRQAAALASAHCDARRNAGRLLDILKHVAVFPAQPETQRRGDAKDAGG